ncbi:Di-and tricarboxylate transporter OS=Yersinia mollaretii ATCC 43969 GN=ymoll0001_10630 PE=4 SV=1 [Gemmata massiliana]|uniref:Di-and tricarboxylate transporter n=1 Tax=Gemmata massiliana TaxID=1210884 RepID=A0A6P2CVV7_9BACT|nr:hypothetical protein [Gemmata massiliana]VTR92737.1 Di-and tricarboxylate transporter OS=Yersinia mollaretii ATCC 43969 GN=ymoll0001_10630 PE=4 SV=1 [Gemmata massiliana]
MAVLLTWALFVGWAVVGTAVLKLARFRWTTVTLLLAPTVGFAALLVPAYILTRFGVPVRLSAAPLGGTLLAVALGVLWRTRPTAARAGNLWRRSRVFAAVFAGTFALTAWPLFNYGFDWVANGNDDMANYCLAATGFREHAFATVPAVDDLLGDRDPTQPLWFMVVLLQIRAGADVLLALTSAWTGLSTQQVFMPVTAALNVALVSAASGLVIAGTRRRAAGALTGALLAVSAANTYGVVQQLIAQVGGLALLCTSLALVSGNFRRLRTVLLVRRAGACGLVFTGLLVFYPEVIPILVGGCVLLGLQDLVRRRLAPRHLGHAAAAIGVMVALVPAYLYGAVHFLAMQSGANGGSSAVVAEIFPYYLTPRGPALVWGFLPFAGTESTLLQTTSIIFGLVLLAAVVVPTVSSIRGRRAFAAALGTIVAMTAALYVQRFSFGLFKIAMFAQPFLWAVVAAWVVTRRTRWAATGAAALVLVVVGLNARVQFWYVDQSQGGENRVEIAAATHRRVFSDFRAQYARRAAAGDVDRVVLAIENNGLSKLLASEIRGTPVSAIGVSPVAGSAEGGYRLMHTAPWLRLNEEWREPLREMGATFIAAQARGLFTVTNPDPRQPAHTLISPTYDRTKEAPERTLVVAGGGSFSLLNRYRFPEAGPALVCAPLSELRNFAVFCDATGARQHYFGYHTPDEIALYQLEQDPVLRGRTAGGIGRAMLLDVLNPAPHVRVLVSCTGSFRSDAARRQVPPVHVAGDRRVALGAIGSGSARLVSPPVATQPVGPGRYLALDFGPTTRNSNQLTAIEQLWGAHLPRDRRQLAGHARDISVLSEEEYAAFRPPERVARFPDDLTHPHLEYSGIYEEGWVGTEFKIRLTQPAPDQEAVIHGMIPQIAAAEFRTEATVLVDGRPTETRVLSPSEFEIRVPGGAGAGPRWIELRFSHSQILPAPDGRSAVALIRSVGFEPKNEALSRPPEALASFPGDLRHPRAGVVGVHGDGWCSGTFSAQVWQPDPARDAVVRGQIPVVEGNTGFRTELVVLLDGAEVAKRPLAPGDFEVRVPAPKGAQAHRLECRFLNTQVLPRPDGRAVGAHLRFVGFEPKQPAP